MDQEWKHTLFQIGRLVWIILIIFAVVWTLKLAIPLLYPFIYGLIIALFINRPVHAIEKRWKMPRWAAVAMVLLLSMGFVIGAFTLLVTQVVIEITHLITVLPVYIQEATDYTKQFITREIVTGFYEQLQQYYSSLDQSYQTKIGENIGIGLTKLAMAGTYLVNSILNGLQSFLISLPNAATVLVISLLAAFFISKDYHRLRERTAIIIPTFLKSRLHTVLENLRSALFGFLRAQLTLISITGFIVIVGLLILRVDYAFTIGIVTGIVDLLPLLGTGSVFIPWILYLFIKGNFSLVIGLSILYAVVVVQRQIMEPKIVADSIGLDPLITLISLFVGLKLLGVAGLILGPVVVVLINALITAHVFHDLWTYIKGNPT